MFIFSLFSLHFLLFPSILNFFPSIQISTFHTPPVTTHRKLSPYPFSHTFFLIPLPPSFLHPFLPITPFHNSIFASLRKNLLIAHCVRNNPFTSHFPSPFFN